MAKASEWADKFNKALSGEGDVFTVLDEYAVETVALIEQRTANSKGIDFLKGSTAGAIRESRQKWNAILDRCPRIKIFGFEQVLKRITVLSPKTKYVPSAA
jgi:hypothetical protein